MKKGISLILALTVLWSSLSLPTFAAATESGEDATEAAVGETQASEAESTEAPTEAVTETATEAPQPIDYPIVTQIENLNSSVQITWDSYENNTLYRVYYRKAVVTDGTWDEKYADVAWVKLAQVSGNSYEHSGLADGEMGIYTVRSVDAAGNFTSNYSHAGWENRFFAPPEIATISSTTAGVRLTWNRPDGAEDYRVYRKEGGTWVRLAQTDATEYTDTTAISGHTYTYTLRMVSATEDRFISGYNEGKSIAYVASPVITSVMNIANGAQLTWTKPSGATAYRVYKKNGTSWERLTQVTSNSYTDTTVMDGETRVYTIRCVDSNGDFVSGFDAVGYTHTYYAAPVIKTISYSDNSYTLTWSAHPTVSAFRIFRRQLGNENLARIAETAEGSSYTDSAIAVNGVYAYTLCALDEKGEEISAYADTVYYRNGSKANGSITLNGKAYRFDNGQPVTGYYSDSGTTYYYRDGRRVLQDWYKIGLYQASYDRTQWLYELMTYTGEKPKMAVTDSMAVFELAKQRGIIQSYTTSDYSTKLTRLFVAQTMVKAMGYQYTENGKTRSVGTLSDSSSTDMMLMAYYGYFIPDDNNKIYPNSQVTASEVDMLRSELRLYQALHGKNLVTFGDSIVYGSGNFVASNKWEGMPELIGKKYGMTYHDYSKPGAVMGRTTGKSHIADQVRSAISKGVKADLIIMDGGTNDTWNDAIALGNITSGYDMSSIGEDNFTNGFEKTMWLITGQWSGVPIVYFRSHQMNLGTIANQKKYGERALALASKWGAAGVDLFTNSGLIGTNLTMAKRYTNDDDTKYRGIHPNALGYAKYYLPFISQSIAQSVSLRLLGDVDGDGSVTAIDATYIQRYCAGRKLPLSIDDLSSGDVNGSGDLDITDATYIQRYLAGMPQPYAIGT